MATAAERQKRWRQNNPDRAREQRKRSYAKHRDKRLAAMKTWHARHPERGRRRQGIIDPERFHELLVCQMFMCAICGADDPTHADHDHYTRLMRGVLCRNCNTGIGMLGDRSATCEAAVRYLRGHGK